MSAKLMGEVWERELPAPQQAVLLALCDHSKPDGTDCYPSVGRLAWMTGKSPRAVQITLAELRERGVLVLVRAGGGRGNPARYRVDLSPLPMKPEYRPAKDEAGCTVSDSETLKPAAGLAESETLKPSARNPEAQRSKTLKPASPEPTTEPTATNGSHPPTPLALFFEPPANGGDPALWMLELWEQALGNGRPLGMTPARRQKLRAMYAEQLSAAPDPKLAWRACLYAVTKSEHHMSRRQFQMPESLLRNPERREQWVQEAVQRIEKAKKKTTEAADFAAEYRRRQQERGR